MRSQQFFAHTLREVPSDAEIISHQLMLRAGMVRRLASGLYVWMPLGLRVVQKVEAIVRKHMNLAAAQEVLMPMVHPAELWQESGRWEQYGPELLRLRDRHSREFCLGPTHEEVITDLVRNNISSYKQLPLNLYQVQTKFRDEIRPRFGVMRAREFIMKDAYSFDMDQPGLQNSYDAMYRAYQNIFTEIGLDFRAVIADNGSIGGNCSHEFHVLADSGEDAIAFSDQSNFASDYAANVEMVEALAPIDDTESVTELVKINTPQQRTIDKVCKYLQITADRTIKTLIVDDGKKLLALVVRGDHQLSMIKAEKHELVEGPLQLANADIVKEQIGCAVGAIGPLNLNIPIIVDRAAVALNQFVCGANETDVHFQGGNWQRDVGDYQVADIREIQAGDPCPDGSGKIDIKRGIEVGHVFQLGDKYSQAMNAVVLDEQGKKQPMLMGCYGIGITRIVAAAIEQNNDDRGIIWPTAIAPFQVALIPINLHKSALVKEYIEQLYQQLQHNNIEVLLFDTPKARLGELLTDAELYGLPHRIIVGERGLKEQQVEYSHRNNGQSQAIEAEKAFEFIQQQLN